MAVPNSQWCDHTSVSTSGSVFALEYVRARIELRRDDEAETMAQWLGLIDLAASEWRFEDCQRLLRTAKGLSLSPHARARVRLAEADFRRRQRSWDAAIAAYGRSADVLHGLGDRTAEAGALSNWGLAEQDRGTYDQAVDLYERALAIYRSLNDRVSVGHLLSNLGSVADARGDWPRAIGHYRDAAQHFERTSATRDLARVTGNLGVAHENQGNLTEAEQCYVRCVDLLDDLDEAYSAAGVRVMVNLGQLHAKKGEWEPAVKCHQSALEISRALGDLESEGATWTNLGTVYTRQADHVPAAECYQRSAELHHRLGDRQGEALALSNLGASQDDLGNGEVAERCYRGSLTLSDEMGDVYGVARAHNNLGVLYEKRGAHGRALDEYRRCVQLVRGQGDTYREVTSLINVCSLRQLRMGARGTDREFDRAWDLAQAQSYHDHMASLCLLRGEATLRDGAPGRDVGHWFGRAGSHALRHTHESSVHRVLEGIRFAVDFLRGRGQADSAKALCAAVLRTTAQDEPTDRNPDFVGELRHLMATLDPVGG